MDVKNHMSVISAGLAATIREWFSEGSNITTVEMAEKVDLSKVRIKKKTAKECPPKKTKEKKEAELTEAAAEPATEVAVATEEKTTIIKPHKAEKPEKPKPEPIVPAGPMLEKPEPAQLSGPQIVRVEAPEPLEHPPRSKPKAKYGAPVTEPLFPDELDEKRLTTTAAKGKKGTPIRRDERTHGRKRYDPDTEVEKRLRFAGQRRLKDLEERRARLDAAGGERIRLRPVRKITSKSTTQAAVTAARPAKVTISEPITVKDLAVALAAKSPEIITKLMKQGIMATANQTIGSDVAELLALDFGTELVVEHRKNLQEQIQSEFDRRERKNLQKRPVVATMLGHVDHGKTSLLDRIRSTHVAASEAGGITQHIGAYQTTIGGHTVTFLDTPGHEAFTAMRARGANMTDVVVLVVAADDGVMPQTIEAIHHAQAANVPVIVALNKIDLPGCNYNRVYSQLAEHELAPAEWGGQTEVVKTSAVTGEGIDALLEHLDYVAELLELKADDTIPAAGWVVEAKMSPQRGPVATLLVKEGRLTKGDVVLAGAAYGRVKTINDSFGQKVKVAISSMPVEITGLSDVPQAGDRFYCLDDINKAKEAAEESKMRSRESSLAKRTQITLDNLFAQIEAGNIKELNIIIKADAQGSVDVLTKYLSELSTDEVKIKILHAAVGGITEGDCLLAEASNAIIIGFNVVTEEHVSKLAEVKGVDIRLYTIIYRITEDLRKSMAGLLEPERQEKTVGRAVVRNTFKVSKVGTVAGCFVSDGLVTKNAKVRLIRDNIVIRDGLSIDSLRHFKDDAREVKAGLECGIKLAKFDDVKIDDVLDFYEIVEVARTL
ncbi:MAG: translation initiation factor IF-2 [Sedimentisphaerales bacterium]|nr:translation initiation factor IF-2 [Sedimentisphaerales bacterium]